MSGYLTDNNIGLDLVRVTEAAALAASNFIGRGDKDAADKAAVDAMRKAFSSLAIDGTIVIGEGEKDNAPMLYNGERVGNGTGPQVDVAVDPVEGTNCVAYGKPNGIAVVGIAEKGKMFNPGRSFYCLKLIVPKEAANCVELEAPLKDNLLNTAKALGKDVSEVNVFVLDKPRHKDLICQIREVGARVILHSDGDVAGSLMTVDPMYPIDMLIGVGGTPEAVISACAIKGSGGQMFTKLAPQSEKEKANIIADGIDLDAIRDVHELISTENCYFAATGICEGEILQGVRSRKEFAVTSSLSTRGKTGTWRFIQAWHNRQKIESL